MPLYLEDGLELELEGGGPLLLEHEFFGAGGAGAAGSVLASLGYSPLGGIRVDGTGRVVTSYHSAVAGGAVLLGDSSVSFTSRRSCLSGRFTFTAKFRGLSSTDAKYTGLRSTGTKLTGTATLCGQA